MMKLLIVDDQISNQFLLVEYLQDQLELENSDIRIAGNGFEAISIAEKNDLDIILMDITMPVLDGLSAAKNILSRYPKIKVIIVSGSNDEESINKSIEIGAKGYLFKENLFTNLISVIQNVNNGYSVFPQCENKDDLLTDNTLSLKPEASDKALKINNIIASQVINFWANNTKEYNFDESDLSQYFDIDPANRPDVIDFIIQGDSPKCNISQEFELRFDRLVSQYIYKTELSKDNFEEKLEILDKQLQYWFYSDRTDTNFSGFFSRLEANSQKLRVKYAENLKQYIDSFFTKSSPIPCLEHLESVEMLLKDAIKENMSELDELIDREKSVSKAYNVLINKIFDSSNDESNQNEIDSLIRAILHIYKAKIQIEASNHAIQVVQGIIRIAQFSIDDLILSIKLLKSVQHELLISDVDEDVSLFIEHKFGVFQDSSRLLNEMESEVGYFINQWGTQASLSPDDIFDKLINKISANSNDILESINNELYALSNK